MKLFFVAVFAKKTGETRLEGGKGKNGDESTRRYTIAKKVIIIHFSEEDD